MLIDPALPPAFRKLTSADLQPVFDVDVSRDTRSLETDEAKIELSLDEGAVIAGQQREEVHEIELELVSGSLEHLFAEARRLSDVVDGRLHARTKSDVGYALTQTARKHWSRASRLCLAADMTAGEAFQLIVRNSFAQLTANDDCARLNLHPEGVHQCRIALRRLRSAFKIFGAPIRRKRLEPIEDEVRWLSKVLGSARDLDVLQADLLEPAIEALGESEQLAPLMSGLQKKKAVAYAAVGAALASARYRHFLIDLCAFGHGDYHDLSKSEDARPGLDQPLRHFASATLMRVHRKLLKRGRNFEMLSKTERHDVRIALKRMRYAVDFFAGVFDEQRHGKFFKSLARLQDDLGRMNDVVIAEAMLARLIGVVPDDGSEPLAQCGRSGQAGFCGRRRAGLAPETGCGNRSATGRGLACLHARQAILAAGRIRGMTSTASTPQ